MESYVEVTKNKTGLPEPLKNNEDVLNNEMILSVPEICKEYGLNGCFVSYRADTDMPSAGYYLVASRYDKIPEPKELYDMYLERNRNYAVQYVDYYIEKVNPNDVMTSILDMIEYCKMHEFLDTIYTEYKCPLPQKLRHDEIDFLMYNSSSYNDDDYTIDIKNMYKANIKNFFKIEKRHSKISFMRKWDDFYRSDKYSIFSSKLQNLFYFFKRKNSCITLKRLWSIEPDLNIIQFTENEYKIFQEQMKIFYPNIPYAVVRTLNVNNGEIKLPKGEENNTELNPFGRTVTPEEYDQLIYKSLTENKPFEKLRVAKAKFFTIAFRKIDEPIVFSLHHKIALNYTKPCKYGDLINNGDVSFTLIPYNEFMNFASLAKSNHLPFALDNGYFCKPCRNAVAVIYNSCREETVKQIKSRIIRDLTNNSHSPVAIKHKQSIEQQISQVKTKHKTHDIHKYEELSL